MNYAALCEFAKRELWAIDRNALTSMLAFSAAGVFQSARRKLPKVQGNVAVLPLYGVIGQRGGIWQELFGGASTEQFGAAFMQAMTDDRVAAVVLDVDSPGGTTAGVQELADIIFANANGKPLAAVSNSEMASAAYWISSQVGPNKLALAAAPGSDVGSIGVFRMHEDVSEMMAADGVRVTFLAVPQYKVEGNPYQPLSADAVEHNMAEVGATYEQFVDSVARGRGVRSSQVKSGFGEGRSFHAGKAAEMGLVDRVATLDSMLRELGATHSVKARFAASAEIEHDLCLAWDGDTVYAPTLVLDASRSEADCRIRNKVYRK